MALAIMHADTWGTDLLSRVMAMKQREKEVKKAHKLEKRRLELAEEQLPMEQQRINIAQQGVDIAKSAEARAGRMESVTAAYQTAQTEYLGALKEQAGRDYLDKARTEFINAQAGMTRSQYQMLDKKLGYLDNLLTSDSDTERALGADLLFERSQNQDLNAMVNALRLGLEETKFRADQQMGQMKFMLDQQGQLLTGFKFATEYGPVLEKKIGKDAFKAGYDAMSEMLGFNKAGAGETKAVGGGRAFSAPGIGSAGGIAPPQQMTLEQAIEALKGGKISTDDLLSAWPSLEEVIDRSLLGGKSAPAAAPGIPEMPGSFEQNLIKRLQQ